MRTRSLRWGLVLALPLMMGLTACDSGTDNPDPEVKYEDPDHAGTCTDGIDNDGDGVTDCEELSCMADAVCNPEITIQDVQDVTSANHPAVGTEVTLTEAVVTAVDGNGNFWMQQGTGAFSGVYVYRPSGDAVAMGDTVSVTGEVDEYNDLTEISNATVTVLSSGATLPAPEALTPADFADGVAMEQWEGVLVTVAYDDGTPMVVDFWADAGAFSMDEEALSVYGKIYEHDALAQEEIESITGVVDYYQGADLWQVLPRSADDVVSLGVPADIEGPLANCDDNDDNDNDGATDCEDSACYGAPACVGGMTIPEVRAVAQGDFVRVVDASVSGVTYNGFWIQQGTGKNTGIFVYTGDAPTVSRDDLVTVVGVLGEYRNLLQITDVVEITATGTAVAEATPVTLADLTADFEGYESVLVTVTKADSSSMLVDAAADTYGVWTVETGALSFDDVFVALPVAAGHEIEEATGIVNWYENSGATVTYWRLLPRDAADVAFTTEIGCFDGVDNDANGSIDCDDSQCAAAPECTTPVVNISDIQDGTVVDGTQVKVTGAVVTAVNGKGAWIQQGTGAYSGVYVYTANLPVAIGDEVSLFGEADEYNDLTQVRSAQVVVTGTAEVPAAEALDVTAFETPADLEPWEGVLVVVTKSTGAMSVTQAPNTYYEWVLDGLVTVDDVNYRATPAEGELVTSVTGPLDYSFGAYKLQPRSADDVVFETP